MENRNSVWSGRPMSSNGWPAGGMTMIPPLGFCCVAYLKQEKGPNISLRHGGLSKDGSRLNFLEVKNFGNRPQRNGARNMGWRYWSWDRILLEAIIFLSGNARTSTGNILRLRLRSLGIRLTLR